MKQRKQRSRQRFLALVMVVMFALSNVTPMVTPALAAGVPYQAGLISINRILGMGDVDQRGTGGGASNSDGTAANPEKTIYFGSFWQNGTTLTKDTAKQGIKWRVLANDEANGVLLLSDQGLYADAFDSNGTSNHWEGSEIQGTLNNGTATTFKADGTVDTWGGFAGDAFDAKELGAVKETTHTAGGKNTGFDNVSTDKLFLLSGYCDENGGNLEGEVYTEAYGFGEDATRVIGATQFAQNVKLYDNSDVVQNYDGFYWWLRSPGSSATERSLSPVTAESMRTV